MKSKKIKILSVILITAMILICVISVFKSLKSKQETSNTLTISETTTDKAPNTSEITTGAKPTSSGTTSEDNPVTSGITTSLTHTTSEITTVDNPTTSESPSEVIITIAEAQTKPQGTIVTVRGVVVAVTDRSFMIADTTSKIVAFINETPINTVGQYVEITGALVAKNGNMRFDDKCSIKVIDEPSPDVTETATEWQAAEIDAFIARAPEERGIGYYVTIFGQLRVSGTYFDLDIKGTNNQVSLAYVTDEMKAILSFDTNYLVTCYVNDVTDGKYLNVYVTNVEEKPYEAITEISVSETEVTLYVGDKKQITASVKPVTAKQLIAYTSEKPEIASVNGPGIITAVAVGSTTIIVTSIDEKADEATVKSVIVVNVIEKVEANM